MNRSYWCHQCDKGYDSRFNHRCQAICQSCLRHECPKDQADIILCDDCNREFARRNCFDHHKNNIGMLAICTVISRCPHCACTVSLKKRNPDNPHQCGESFCKLCGIYSLPGQHKCYIQKKVFGNKDKKQHRNAKFLYFDFETFVDVNMKLVSNLAVISDDAGHETVSPADDRPLGKDISEELCEFIFFDDHKDHYVIAHNFRVSNEINLMKYLRDLYVALRCSLSTVISSSIGSFAMDWLTTLS